MAVKTTIEVTADTKDAVKDINKLKTSGEGLKSSLKTIGATSTVAFAAMATAAGLALESFGDFDNAMRGVKTLLDDNSFSAGDLEKNFKKMGDEVLALTSTMPVELDKATKSLFDLVSAGVDADDATKTLGVSAKLAVAGLTDISTATDGLTSALNAYGIDAAEADVVAGKFFLAQKAGKCFAKGTEILLHEGVAKKVENIAVGDLLMGDDNTPRKVLSLGRGQETMYKITMRDGSTYTVNESHILSLKRPAHVKGGKHVPEKITNLTILEYLAKTNDFKARNLGYKSAIELDEKPTHIDPYLLGLWLGDGHSASPRITTMDSEVADYLESVCEKNFWNFKEYVQENNRSNVYSLTKDRICRGQGSFTEQLHKYGLLNNKHIPTDYRVNSLKNRLELLAGLIDTDGSLGRTKYPFYEFSNKNKRLMDEFIWVARSCGFYCRRSQKEIKGQVYYRAYLSGDLGKIPCKIQRKKTTYKTKRDTSRQSFKIEKLDVGDYYGFEIDGNRLFILNNFNVTHNTTIAELSQGFGKVGGTANAMGVSFNEVLSSVSALTTAGIDTQTAYTSLKAVLSNISKPTKEAAEEAERLGVSFDQNALASKGLKGFLDDLTGSAKFNKESVTKLFGSVEAVNAIFSLTGEQADTFGNVLNDLSDDVGAVTSLNAAYETQSKSLNNQVKIVSGTFKALTVEIGKRLTPIFSKLLKPVGKALKFFQSLDDDTKDLIVTVGLIATALAGALAAFSGIALALPALIASIATLTSGFAIMATGLTTGFAALSTAATVGFAAMSTGFSAFTAVLVANPIGAIVAAIVAVIAGLVVAWNNNFLGIQEVTYGVFGGLEEFFVTFFENIGKIFGGFGDVLTGVFTLDVKQIKKGLESIKGALTKTTDATIKGFNKSHDLKKKQIKEEEDLVKKKEAALLVSSKKTSEESLTAAEKATDGKVKAVEGAEKTIKDATLDTLKTTDSQRVKNDNAWTIAQDTKLNKFLDNVAESQKSEEEKINDIKKLDIKMLDEALAAKKISLEAYNKNKEIVETNAINNIAAVQKKNDEDWTSAQDTKLEKVLENLEETSRTEQENITNIKELDIQFLQEALDAKKISVEEFTTSREMLEKTALENISAVEFKNIEDATKKWEEDEKKRTEATQLAETEREELMKDRGKNVSKFLSGGFKSVVSSGVETMTNVLVPGFGGAAASMFEFLSQDSDKFVENLTALFDTEFLSNVSDNISALMENLPKLLKGLITSVIEVLPDITIKLVELFTDPKFIVDLIKGIIQGLWKGLLALLKKLAKKVASIFTAGFDDKDIEELQEQTKKDTKEAKDFGNKIISGTKDVGSSIASGAKKTGKAISGFFGFAEGGQVPLYAAGGMFVPRGTDTVPAMLSPGEFIVNRSATAGNLDLLKAINSGASAGGGNQMVDINLKLTGEGRLGELLENVLIEQSSLGLGKLNLSVGAE